MKKKTKIQKDFDKQFGLYVKKKRLKKKWSQKELASRMENNYQNISSIERGEVSPSLFWCNNLAKAFDLKLLDFLKGFQEIK